MNKVILMGRLTKDPEVRYAQGSEPLAVARNDKASRTLTLSDALHSAKLASLQKNISKKVKWSALSADYRFVPGTTTKGKDTGQQKLS